MTFIVNVVAHWHEVNILVAHGGKTCPSLLNIWLSMLLLPLHHPTVSVKALFFRLSIHIVSPFVRSSNRSCYHDIITRAVVEYSNTKIVFES